MYNGFVRVAAAVPQLRIADCDFNVKQIISLIRQAEEEKVQVVCFPELSITGYTCGDLFFQQQLLYDTEKALSQLLVETFGTTVAAIIGMPVRTNNRIFNVGMVIQGGKILGVVPKTYIPNNNEFYEKRWAASADDSIDTISINEHTVPFGTNLLFTDREFTFSLEICEDLWNPIPPSCQHAMHGAEIIFNLSASNELVGKNNYRKRLIEQQSARCRAGYMYVASGIGESTTDSVFSGASFIAENGTILAEGERFKWESQLLVSEIDIEHLRADRFRNSNYELGRSDRQYRTIQIESAHYKTFRLKRTFNKYPFVPSDADRDLSCEDIYLIQSTGLARRWQHTKAHILVIGISGGLDSTLALMVCVKTADMLGYDRKRIIGVTMPGFGTTDRTYANSIELMKSLGITMREIPIRAATLQHFEDIGHDADKHDVTYENAQARERTQILMDIANQQNGLVVGTGDLSELALGWATYNGDHMSMYAVNTSVPKTLVRYLVDWISEQTDNKVRLILKDVLDTPVSPELLPVDKSGKTAQITEDIVGPYELHDFFLYYFVRFGFSINKIFFLATYAFKDDYAEAEIKKWLKVFIRRFFSQQFKRSCMPDGPKVGSISLSPRADWRMPSDAGAFAWEEDALHE